MQCSHSLSSLSATTPSVDVQFAAANSEELGVKCVPSLNLVYTEEEGYVTADVAEEKSLVRYAWPICSLL